MVIRMGTYKSKQEINQLLSKCKNIPFKHRGELADYLGIHMKTLRKWVEYSDYDWNDFNINYNKKTHEILIEKGGVKYLEKKFKAGYNITTLAKELNMHQGTLDKAIKYILDNENVNKKELGYIKRKPVKTNKMFHLIDKKGGLPYLLQSKMEGKNINDIADEIGDGITREFITKYLKQYNLTFTKLSSYNNVYYIPHLKKWRGTVIDDDKIYDTQLYDTIFEALNEINGS